MKKKGIAWEFIVRLLIAVIALTVVFSIAYSLFRTTDAATESFEKLVAKIESAKSWTNGTYDSIRLDMDDETAILGFGKAYDELKGGRNFSLTKLLDRPEQCQKNQACICRAKKLSTKRDLSYYIFGIFGMPGVNFEDLDCFSLEGMDFTNEIKINKLTVGDHADIYIIVGGFYLERSSFQFDKKNHPESFGRFIIESQPSPRSHSIRIEKGPGDLVGVCIADKGSCFE